MRIGDIGAVKLTLRELPTAIALRRHSKRLGQWVADRCGERLRGISVTSIQYGTFFALFTNHYDILLKRPPAC